MKVKQINIYEVNGGQKVRLLSTQADSTKELTIEEVDEAITEIAELFYSYDKIKLTDKEGNAFVVRGGENKTFTIEAEFLKE